MSRTVAILAALVGMVWVFAAAAQSYVPPDEIVTYLRKDLQERDFVEGLACELGRVLAAPVHAEDIDLPLRRSYLMTPTQLDADKLRAVFGDAPPSWIGVCSVTWFCRMI